jgi:hypothetical protein
MKTCPNCGQRASWWTSGLCPKCRAAEKAAQERQRREESARVEEQHRQTVEAQRRAQQERERQRVEAAYQEQQELSRWFAETRSAAQVRFKVFHQKSNWHSMEAPLTEAAAFANSLPPNALINIGSAPSLNGLILVTVWYWEKAPVDPSPATGQPAPTAAALSEPAPG